MKLPFFWVDAFSNKVFAGNPAGVVPLDRWPTDALMQRVAFENGLAETAFLVAKSPGRYDLRWFTPSVEVELCGHATLASAYVLFTELGFTGDVVTFDTRAGPLTVRRGQGDRLELDFPSRPALPCATSLPLGRALGSTPMYVAQARDTLCVFSSAQEVLGLRPDFTALAQLETFACIATAPGQDCDFVSRFFAPRAGVNEDPVTGSAHCTLVPYWAQRLGKTQLHARQVSARGGELFCELRGDRVGIAGHAVLYLRGEITI